MLCFGAVVQGTGEKSSLDLQSVRLSQVVLSSLQPHFSSQVPKRGLCHIIL